LGLELTDLDISRLILIFRGHINSVSEDGKLFITSEEFKKTIGIKYLEDVEDKRNIHSHISNYLAKLPDNEPLKSAELMYHYIRGGKYAEAMHYFYPGLPENEYKGAAESVVDEILYYGSDEANEELGVSKLFKDFLTAEPIEIWDIYQFQIEIITSVYKVIQNRIPLNAREFILSNSLSILQGLVDKGFDDEYLKNMILAGRQRLAEVKTALGDETDELLFYGKNLDKIENDYKNNPDDVNAQSNYALTLYKKANQILREGLTDEALDMLFKAYEITIETSKLEPENPMHQIGIAEILQEIATIYKNSGNEEKAREALNIAFNSSVAAYNLDTSQIDSYKSIARAHLMLGDLEEWAKNNQEAYEQYDKSYKIRQELAFKNADNIILMQDYAIINYRLGSILNKLDDNENALQFAREAAKIFSMISQSDTDNKNWEKDKLTAEALVDQLGGNDIQSQIAIEFAKAEKLFEESNSEAVKRLADNKFYEADEYLITAQQSIKKCYKIRPENKEYLLK